MHKALLHKVQRNLYLNINPAEPKNAMRTPVLNNQCDIFDKAFFFGGNLISLIAFPNPLKRLFS